MWTDKSALYDLQQQRLIQEPIDPSRGDSVLPYLYPPFFSCHLDSTVVVASAAFVAMNHHQLGLADRRDSNINTKAGIKPTAIKLVGTGDVLQLQHYAMLEAQTCFIALLMLVFFVTALNGRTEFGQV
jgi:hypothetical protein